MKKSLVKAENKQKVIESYDRLIKILENEADFIAKNGPSMVPEIDFNEVRQNGQSFGPSQLTVESKLKFTQVAPFLQTSQN